MYYSENCNYDETYVPDDNFEQTLIDLGHDDVLDDYVLTKNINAINSLSIAGENIRDLTGIEDFVGLTFLSCSRNLLTNLDISENTRLTKLDCSNNKLTSLDVSKNTALSVLWCDNNELTNLDLSVNTELTSFWCNSNQLTSLKVKNGNNTTITTFNSTNNPDLTCITVDDATWSTANWTNIDTQTSFNEDCATLGTGDYQLSGFNVYPNPSEGTFYVSVTEEAEYQLINVNGQVLKQGNLVIGENHLNFENVLKGLYFITIKNNNTFYSEKVLLK